MALYKIIAVLSIIASVLTIANADVRPQIIRFFTSASCIPATSGVPYYDYQVSINISNQAQPQPQSLQSYCVLRGAWRVEYVLAQTESDYNISLGDSCTKCISKGTGNRRNYGIVQRIGGPDLTKASITLYTDVDFRGRDASVDGWEFSLNDTYSFSSFAFSSFSNWTWQAYSRPRFQGSSTCFSPNFQSEVTLINRNAIQVGSVRLGCRNSGNSLPSQGIGIVAVIITALAMTTTSIVL